MKYNVDDCVHSISLPHYVKAIINTRQFQRLRNLKQLGVSHFVFPAGVHTRYEHCIGTAYLCLRLLEYLEQNTGLVISELHKKCVILAGLLHDIGHGPFSHLWEGVVHQGAHKSWTHEDQSKKMVEHLMMENNICLADSADVHEWSLKLITSLITGDCKVWRELLAPDEMYLTEIVSNKYCNIDVDKCDYLLRDEHYLGAEVTVKPFIDFLAGARVVYDSDGTSHIAYDQKDFELIENMFDNRAFFHLNIYQHHEVAATEKMVQDICIAASKGIQVFGLNLTEVQQYSEAYTQLDDSILNLIAKSPPNNEHIIKAQALLEDLYTPTRRYKLIWESCDSDGKMLLEQLINKFGKIFCIVPKVIPAAEVPRNIPLYNADFERVTSISSLKLAYKSKMLYCTSPDNVLVNNVKNYVSSLNNNI